METSKSHRSLITVANRADRTTTRTLGFMERMKNDTQKPFYSLSSIGALRNSAVKRAGIRRRNPYHTRHTFACWLLSAGANPSFIANPMGHENAQRVYEIYATRIETLDSEQVAMFNPKLALKMDCPTGAPFDI